MESDEVFSAPEAAGSASNAPDAAPKKRGRWPADRKKLSASPKGQLFFIMFVSIQHSLALQFPLKVSLSYLSISLQSVHWETPRMHRCQVLILVPRSVDENQDPRE